VRVRPRRSHQFVIDLRQALARGRAQRQKNGQAPTRTSNTTDIESRLRAGADMEERFIAYQNGKGRGDGPDCPPSASWAYGAPRSRRGRARFASTTAQVASSTIDDHRFRAEIRAAADWVSRACHHEDRGADVESRCRRHSWPGTTQGRSPNGLEANARRASRTQRVCRCAVAPLRAGARQGTSFKGLARHAPRNPAPPAGRGRPRCPRAR